MLGVRSSAEKSLPQVWHWQLAPNKAEVDSGTEKEGCSARAGKLSLVWRALHRHIVADRAESP